jgi:mannose-6-phosphate isomerase-like protein (cupin superfamily)
MQTIDLSNVETMPNMHDVDARKLHDTEDVQVVHIELAPAEALKPHVTPVDVFFYGLEGRGVVEVGEEQQPIARDTLVYSPANVRHRLMNESDTAFRFLVVKTPRPERRTKS